MEGGVKSRIHAIAMLLMRLGCTARLWRLWRRLSTKAKAKTTPPCVGREMLTVSSVQSQQLHLLWSISYCSLSPRAAADEEEPAAASESVGGGGGATTAATSPLYLW